MSNHSFSNKPIPPNSTGGNKPQGDHPRPQPGTSKDPASTQEEALKKLLSQMVDSDPAKMAEIIHQWLNEDKK